MKSTVEWSVPFPVHRTTKEASEMKKTSPMGRCLNVQARGPVQTVKNYLLHLNPEADFFYQKPRAFGTAKFNPEVDPIWYRNSPVQGF